MNQTFEALSKIQSEWGLSVEQIARLIHADPAAIAHWLELGRAGRLAESEPVKFDGVPPLVMIHRRLSERYPRTEDQIRWLFDPNSDFGGNKPIDVAASSLGNLFWLGYYLESSRKPFANSADSGNLVP